MIHLDTNYLIGLAVKGSTQSQRAGEWLSSGESLGASALVWAEFLNGPVAQSEISLVEAVLGSNLITFDKQTAVLASQLYNQAGRKRGLRIDCMIAATAILGGASFATENKADFAPLVQFGLKLI